MSDSHPKASAIRVLLVDDHAMLRQGLRSALLDYPNIDVVGEAGDGEAAIVCAAKLHPTVIVMDISMRRMDGITATRLIKAQFPQIAVIGLSVERKDYLVYAMQKAGAFEVITRDNAVLDLYSAIQRAVAAVQPVLIMEEAPDSEQAIKGSNPATTAELMSETNKRPAGEDPDNYS